MTENTSAIINDESKETPEEKAKRLDAKLKKADSEQVDKTLKHAKLDSDNEDKSPFDRLMEKLDDMCGRLDKLEAKKSDSRKRKAADDKDDEDDEGDPGDTGDDVEKAFLEARAKKSLEADKGKKRRSDGGDLKKPKEEAKEVYADSAVAAAWRGKVDKVLTGVCLESPKPLVGESFNEYRRRVLRPIVKYSPRFKALDIYAINDDATFDAVEGAILADAETAGKSGGFLDGDNEYTLIERTSVDRTGRRSSEFFGRHSFTAVDFGGINRRLVTGWASPGNRR
jgi:hypothetical protein